MQTVETIPSRLGFKAIEAVKCPVCGDYVGLCEMGADGRVKKLGWRDPYARGGAAYVCYHHLSAKRLAEIGENMERLRRSE